MPNEMGAKNTDLRNQPAYTLAEATRYLKLPAATLRSWVAGRPYPKRKGMGRFSLSSIRPGSSLRCCHSGI